MDGDIEAFGAAATAGLAAREFDRAGARGHGHQLTECQNCQARLAGPFCHACGQSGHVHRTLGHVLEEFAHGILHVDSKGWRTLPLLVLNPGKLTREYVHGRRARYIAPFALFLFAFFLMFLAFGFGGSLVRGDLTEPMSPAERAAAVADAERDLARARAKPTPDPAELRALEASAAVLRAGGDDPALHVLMRRAAADVHVDFGGGNDAALTAKVRRAFANPELTLYKVEQKAYKLSFLLVPLSVPLLWLLFAARRGVTLYDHTVFVLYSLAFMSLLTVLLIALNAVDAVARGPLIPALAVAAPPLHMFAQLKGAYQLSTRGALWRVALLAFGATTVLAIYLGLMLVIGLID